jgi:streptomycin 6-kinase
VITIPVGFADSAAQTFGAAGTAWCATLPDVVSEYVARWSLTVDLPVGAEPWYGMCGIVVPVRTAAGEAAVLKISWVDEETQHEYAALAVWAGRGAVRLLAADGPRRVLLLERLDARRDLRTVPIDDAVGVLAELLHRLSVPTPLRLPTVSDQAATWVDELPGRWRAAAPPHDVRLLDRAIGLAREIGTESDAMIIHSDLHYENVLAALPDAAPGRGDWLAIDPKPMAGPPEFGALPALWNRLADLDGDDPEAALRRRLRLLSDAAGLDVELARAWSIVRAVETVVWNAEIGMTEEEHHRPAWIATTFTAG